MNEQDIQELYQRLAREYNVQITPPKDKTDGWYCVAHPRNKDDILLLMLPESFDSKSTANISASYLFDERESPEEVIEGLQLLASLRDQLTEKGYTPTWCPRSGYAFIYEEDVDIRNPDDVEKVLKDYLDLKL